MSIGGEVIDNKIYKSINFDNKELILDNKKISYNNLVGADGVFSSLGVNDSLKVKNADMRPIYVISLLVLKRLSKYLESLFLCLKPLFN